MNDPSADRNLLFGILALQMDFIRRDDLIAAMNAWVLDKAKPLGQILREMNKLAEDEHALLLALVQKHLERHHLDPRQSLSAVSTLGLLRQHLGQIADADVRSSLDLTPADGAGGPAGATVFHPPPATPPGGRFRILHHHARGGLGDVFVAEDTELHRQVALKEIQQERADDPASRVRFVLEAEITGRLEHPGIVPVYGLGAYPGGRPYYAMRLIRGESLQAAVERFHAAGQPGRDRGERALQYRQLLRRFIDVCNAVAYAHSRGVIHRDLKPANVMLGKYGETLVVDWGLAKAGAGPQGGETPADAAESVLRPSSGSDRFVTRSGTPQGTPTYMSPEQADGRLTEVGPASDIYGLGATLYSVLTGRKPFDGPDVESVLALVRLGQLVPPRQVKPDTPPALDAVCRKAMALRPTDRYASALALAAEVEHWLADEPVAAYPEPWRARLARWGRRHRTAVAAAAALLVAAVVGLSASTVLVWREQQNTAEQKRAAERNLALAEDLSFGAIDLIASAEAQFAASPASQAARKKILTAASRTFRHFLEGKPDDPELRGRAAQVYRFTANVHRLENETAAADRLYRDSVRLAEGLVEQFPQDPAHRELLSNVLRDQAHIDARVGRLRGATDSLRRAVALASALRAEDPERPWGRMVHAAALLDLSAVVESRGMVSEAVEHAEKAVELFRGLLQIPPQQRHPLAPLLLAEALGRVAVAEREAGRLDRARAVHNEAVRLLAEMEKQRPEGVNLADVVHFQARCRLEQCRTWVKTPPRRANAEKNLGLTAAVWAKMAADYPRIPMYRESQGLAHLERGRIRAEDGRRDEARADFDKSRELLEGLVKEYPAVPAYRGDLGETFAALGLLARGGGGTAEAAGWFARAEEALRLAAEQSPDDAQIRRSLEAVRAERSK
jgi:tetratricopeptide (TPR) repeat protein/tRNA A-37 threonylcarbamoyl transferase component Bud32